jgi:hypothetical protein
MFGTSYSLISFSNSRPSHQAMDAERFQPEAKRVRQQQQQPQHDQARQQQLQPQQFDPPMSKYGLPRSKFGQLKDPSSLPDSLPKAAGFEGPKTKQPAVQNRQVQPASAPLLGRCPSNPVHARILANPIHPNRQVQPASAPLLGGSPSNPVHARILANPIHLPPQVSSMVVQAWFDGRPAQAVSSASFIGKFGQQYRNHLERQAAFSSAATGSNIISNIGHRPEQQPPAATSSTSNEVDAASLCIHCRCTLPGRPMQETCSLCDAWACSLVCVRRHMLVCGMRESVMK